MKVFVWRSYGKVNVYALETVEQEEKLKARLNTECKYFFGLEEFTLEIVGEHESFEQGTGFYTLKE